MQRYEGHYGAWPERSLVLAILEHVPESLSLFSDGNLCWLMIGFEQG